MAVQKKSGNLLNVPRMSFILTQIFFFFFFGPTILIIPFVISNNMKKILDWKIEAEEK